MDKIREFLMPIMGLLLFSLMGWIANAVIAAQQDLRVEFHKDQIATEHRLSVLETEVKNLK